MKDSDLIKLIDKYFEGATSLEEERLLRRALYESASQDSRIEEVKAVMAYVDMSAAFRERPKNNQWENIPTMTGVAGRNRSRRFKVAAWGAAASVALLLGGGLIMRWDRADRNCYTMIACVEDSSHDKAFNLINTQLEAMGEASGVIEADLQETLSLILE